MIQRLEQCAKQAASSATPCISAAQNATSYSEDIQTKEILIQDCQAVAEQIPRLVSGVKNTLANPDNTSVQLGLIEASEQFFEPATQVAASSRNLQPSVRDQASSQHLYKCSVTLNHSVHELRSSAQRARDACAGNELASALDAVKNMRNVLAETKRAAREGTL